MHARHIHRLRENGFQFWQRWEYIAVRVLRDELATKYARHVFEEIEEAWLPNCEALCEPLLESFTAPSSHGQVRYPQRIYSLELWSMLRVGCGNREEKSEWLQLKPDGDCRACWALGCDYKVLGIDCLDHGEFLGEDWLLRLGHCDLRA